MLGRCHARKAWAKWDTVGTRNTSGVGLGFRTRILVSARIRTRVGTRVRARVGPRVGPRARPAEIYDTTSQPHAT